MSEKKIPRSRQMILEQLGVRETSPFNKLKVPDLGQVLLVKGGSGLNRVSFKARVEAVHYNGKDDFFPIVVELSSRIWPCLSYDGEILCWQLIPADELAGGRLDAAFKVASNE